MIDAPRREHPSSQAEDERRTPLRRSCLTTKRPSAPNRSYKHSLISSLGNQRQTKLDRKSLPPPSSLPDDGIPVTTTSSGTRTPHHCLPPHSGRIRDGLLASPGGLRNVPSPRWPLVAAGCSHHSAAATSPVTGKEWHAVVARLVDARSLYATALLCRGRRSPDSCRTRLPRRNAACPRARCVRAEGSVSAGDVWAVSKGHV